MENMAKQAEKGRSLGVGVEAGATVRNLNSLLKTTGS